MAGHLFFLSCNGPRSRKRVDVELFICLGHEILPGLTKRDLLVTLRFYFTIIGWGAFVMFSWTTLTREAYFFAYTCTCSFWNVVTVEPFVDGCLWFRLLPFSHNVYLLLGS